MRKIRVFAVVSALTVVFIWGNSILPASVSGSISHFFADIFHGISGSGANSDEIIRKVAHFAEFAVLGVWLTTLFSLLKIDKAIRVMSVVCCGMFFPLLDETIQMFNDRGPSVRDIWIDIAGYTLGSLIVALIVVITRKMKKEQQEPCP